MRVLKHFLLCWFCLASMAFGQSVAHKELYDALHLEKIADILRREGVEDGLKTGEVYLGQSYDVTSFEKAVQSIYSADAMEAFLLDGLVDALPDQTAKDLSGFFAQGLGAEVALLETSARSAISYEEVEISAIGAAKEAEKGDRERYLMLRENLTELELVEMNMTGAFSAQYAFLSELAELEEMRLTHDDILALLLESEGEMRQEILDWLMGFSYMAYKPLNDDDLTTYLGFLRSSDGKVLNAALFDIFNDLSVQTSTALARAIVSFRKARDL